MTRWKPCENTTAQTRRFDASKQDSNRENEIMASTVVNAQPVRADEDEIEQFLADFGDEYRKRLARAYQICGDETGGGTFVIPKLVLISTAESFGLPPSMDRKIRGVKRIINTHL